MTGRSPTGRAGRPADQAPAGLGDTATIPSAAFTPGPWQRKTDYPFKPDCVTIVANVDGDCHADGSTTYTYDFIATCEDEYGEYCDSAVANALLIAAAPELYEACVEALAFVEAMEGALDKHFLVGGIIYSALARARGQCKRPQSERAGA